MEGNTNKRRPSNSYVDIQRILKKVTNNKIHACPFTLASHAYKDDMYLTLCVVSTTVARDDGEGTLIIIINMSHEG